MIMKLKMLPSGPTVPPVSHTGPCNVALERCPGKTLPLLGTENRKVSPKSNAACQPTTSQRLSVRLRASAKTKAILTTLSAHHGDSPWFSKCTLPKPKERIHAAGQK